MSVVNLSKRHTNQWDEVHEHLQSPDSMIYINEGNNINPTSMDLEVGSAYIVPGSNQTFAISETEGLKIKPHESVVIYTKQRVKLPYNVFGVITGKGTYIFKGCFLSAGKIDPAFEGHLKIGFYNGGNSSVKLETGKAFATAFFLNTDVTLTAPLENYQTNLNPDYPSLKWYQSVYMYIKQHWISFIAWATIAIPTALLYITEFIKLIQTWSSQN